MSKYVVTLLEKNPEAFSEELVVAHVEHLRNLASEGILVICGPLKGTEFAMQILNAETLEEATRLAEADPFLTNNFYNDFTIYELIEANEGNNYLLK